MKIEEKNKRKHDWSSKGTGRGRDQIDRGRDCQISLSKTEFDNKWRSLAVKERILHISDCEDRGSFLDENQNETKDIIKFILVSITLYYDMLCCH